MLQWFKQLVFGEMKPEVSVVGIEDFVKLKIKMYSLLVDKNLEDKKNKGPE